MQFDEKKVENTSLYQAYFSDASGVCRDTSLVQINVNNPVEITLEGANHSICAQEIIQITASGADNYKWNEFNEGATFTLKTTTPQKMQINLRAKQAFKEIFCTLNGKIFENQTDNSLYRLITSFIFIIVMMQKYTNFLD